MFCTKHSTVRMKVVCTTLMCGVCFGEMLETCRHRAPESVANFTVVTTFDGHKFHHEFVRSRK